MEQATIQMIPITSIQPAKYNPRRKLKKTDKEYEDIKASMDTFGLVQPLVWNKTSGNLVGGHQRLNIMKKEQPETDKVQCAVVELDDIEEKRLNIILNKQGEELWSAGKLASLVSELSEQCADIWNLGFSEGEIDEILKKGKPKAQRDKDDAPAPPEKAATKVGDLYDFADEAGILTHRLICGDSTKPATWEALFKDKDPASLLFTDPPYGVSYKSQSKSDKMQRQDLENDTLRHEELREFLQDIFDCAAGHTTQDAGSYVFYASRCHIPFELALEGAGWEVKQQLIWAKQMVLGRSDFHWAHEPILYCQRAGGKAAFHGDRANTTLWQELSVHELKKAIGSDEGTVWFEKRDPPSSYIHPTQKPTSLVERAIKLSTTHGETLCDPFAGSGSTLIGAELSQRSSMSIELDPKFADAIVARYLGVFGEDRIVTKNGEQIETQKYTRLL